MTTDIHSLDRYIGRYVSMSNGVDGMAGYAVNVLDKVEYTPGPVRVVVLNYGFGFPVGADTEIDLAVPPNGEVAPEVENPIVALHRALHADDSTKCIGPECPHGTRSTVALRSFRVWQMRQSDQYWKNVWVDKAEAFRHDPCSVGEILRDAGEQGAPPHILDSIRAIAEKAREGEA